MSKKKAFHSEKAGMGGFFEPDRKNRKIHKKFVRYFPGGKLEIHGKM